MIWQDGYGEVHVGSPPYYDNSNGQDNFNCQAPEEMRGLRWDEVPPSVWMTNDGRCINIVDLTDDHLRNILGMLRRKQRSDTRTALRYGQSWDNLALEARRRSNHVLRMLGKELRTNVELAPAKPLPRKWPWSLLTRR